MHETYAHGPITLERFVLGPFETNCYVVRLTGGAASGNEHVWLVDAGFEPGAMLDRLSELEASPERILLTHAHADHIAGLAQVKAQFPDAPVLIHQAEAGFLADPVLNLSAGFGAPVVAPGADSFLRDEQKLALGDIEWRALATPGHSPGGVTLYCPAASAALVGDTLFAGSIGRFDFPTSDEQLLYRSIREALYALPDDTAVYSGHGEPTTIGKEKATNPFVRGA